MAMLREGKLVEATPRGKEATPFSIGRGLFALIAFLAILMPTGFSKTEGEDVAVVTAVLLWTVIGVMRLRSIGYSGWYILFGFLPVVNVVLGYRLCAYPPGYATFKRADTAMRVVAWIYGGIFALLLLALLIPAFLKLRSSPRQSSLISPSKGSAGSVDTPSKLRAKAESGDAFAQSILGCMYRDGKGVTQDSAQAAIWYRKAAEQGERVAQSSLGIMYLNGDGVPKDSEEAVRWLRKSAEQGEAEAEYNLGVVYAEGYGVLKDSVEAVKWYRKAGEQGYAAAQNNLGLMYANGDGVPKDSTEATKWYRMAAEQGVATAQYNLGRMYATGNGAPQNSTEALKWYRKAAEQGYAAAQNNLGLMYANGVRVSKDSVEAVKWYRLSAEQGNADAQFDLGYMYENGEGVSKNNDEAVKWYRLAAEQGNANAPHNLGLMYATGNSVQKNSTEAAKWYRIAAERGNTFSQFNLGLMYATGNGVPKNGAQAEKWYRMAAEQGHSRAQTNLGQLYGTGDGVPKNTIEAIKWYRLAAKQGSVLAQYNLGYIYENGDGVPKNSAEAIKWYHLAAEQGNEIAQNDLGLMYANGEGVPKDEIEGLAWMNIAASAGDKQSIKNREIMESRIGRQFTLVAQQRTREILKEIEDVNRAPSSSVPNDSNADVSPADDTPIAVGSGAIVSIDGYVLTAAHVVAGAKNLKIETTQGVLGAKVVRVDEDSDIAVLKLDAGTYPALPIGSSRKVRLGQTVATIGFPNVEIQGFSPKVTKGEISSLNGIGDDSRMWQISVPVQPGNSGGALLDEDGNLIGVVVSKLGLKATEITGDIPQNVNYAVKSIYAIALLEPYLKSNAPEPNQATPRMRFEDMVAKAQQSVVLIVVY